MNNINYREDQLPIISYESGTMAVPAVPGAGKTFIVTNLVAKLLCENKHKGGKILILTYMNSAVNNFKHRIKKILQDNWANVQRKYVALVNGKVVNKKDSLKSYLAETKTLYVYSTKNEKLGRFAQTDYEVISQNNSYSLLDIDIKTGRKNQIRVQLNDIGHPIVGDKKYSNIKKDPLRRLCLHAYNLKLLHPITHKEINVECEIPKEFRNLAHKKSI